jgi:predicted nuclease with TOPRIM domain
MEARLTELYSSLRALLRSNQQLEEALSHTPGDADFIEALEENWSVMRNQRALAVELVTDMKRQGVNIDIAEDICKMSFPAKKEQEQHPTVTETGVYL